MTQNFYDRKEEINLLKEKYEKIENGEFLAVYGRRRVGKTELIKKFMDSLKNEKKLYLYVDLAEKQDILNSFSNAIFEQIKESVKFADFDDFFEYIDKKTESGKFILVIDEFQRFLETSPEFITKLQNIWDSKLKLKKIMIIIVGSSIGMIKKITESGAGSLYGRVVRTKISPFRYADFRLMFKDLNEIEKIEMYASFGGTPFYLEKAKNFKTSEEAIFELLIKKGGELIDEPKNLLEYENLRNHSRYNSILHAIASGKEILKEIEDFTKIRNTTLPAYLNRLENLLDIIGKKKPVLGKDKLDRYFIKDNLFRFWYKFIFSNQISINLGNYRYILQTIKENYNSYVGRVFENIIRELVALYINKKIKNFEINFEEIGSWWDKRGSEIDLVAYNKKEKRILIGEIKWTNKPVNLEILNELIEKSKLIEFKGEYHFILVSKSGFTKECIDRMKEIKCIYLDINDVSSLFNEAV